jgi:acetate kinase
VTAYVLVVNAGSSSLKYSLVDGETGSAPATGTVERIGESSGRLTHETGGEEHTEELAFPTFEDALQAALDAFEAHGPSLAAAGVVAVGHRVVHGGSRFTRPTLVEDGVMAAVQDLVPLAPLHNPANLEGIEVARKLFPELPQVMVFDTAFHHTIPEVAHTYAVPRAWRDEHSVRRYGFHGTSHAFVSREAARALGRPVEDTNVIVLHLGNGASATAVRAGSSVDTSMGLTPLEGLVMGTRSGDLDPAVPMHLHRSLGWSLEEIDRALNRDSGLKGLAGENDFREVMRMRAGGDGGAALAFDVYCYRIRKYVGAYYAVLGTVDAIVFTAGVGQHNPELRSAALEGLSRLGIAIDPARNEGPIDGPTVVSADSSEVAVLVVPTNEEFEIARQALAVVRTPAG